MISNSNYAQFEDLHSMIPPPAFAPSYSDQQEEKSYTRFIGDAHIQTLRNKFYDVTKEAKGLKDSLNTLFDPLAEYLADLQMDNRTKTISGSMEESRSLPGLIELAVKQKKIFEQAFKPFLSDHITPKVEKALESFENFISTKLEILFPTESKNLIETTKEAFDAYQLLSAPGRIPTAPHPPMEGLGPLEEKGYTRFINDFNIFSLKQEFHHVTANAIGLQHSLNTLLEPLTEYLVDLQVNNETQEMKGITIKNRSLKDLIQLIDKQNDIFKNEFRPYLEKSIGDKVEASLRRFEDFINKNVQEFFPKAAEKHREEIDNAKKTICSARANKFLDVLGILCCIGWCPIEFCCAFCFAIFLNKGEFSQVDKESRIAYCFFPPCESIKKLHSHYQEQNRIIEQAAPKIQRMI